MSMIIFILVVFYMSLDAGAVDENSISGTVRQVRSSDARDDWYGGGPPSGGGYEGFPGRRYPGGVSGPRFHGGPGGRFPGKRPGHGRHHPGRFRGDNEEYFGQLQAPYGNVASTNAAAGSGVGGASAANTGASASGPNAASQSQAKSQSATIEFGPFTATFTNNEASSSALG